MRIFVAGLGFCGRAIALRLAEAGHEVRGVNRSGEGEVAGVRILGGDVLAGDGLRALSAVPPVDLMISALSGTGQADAEAYRRVYVEGPARIADALRWRGARKIWFLGSTGVYGGADGEQVDEETPPDPSHRAGEVQLEAEAALRSAADDTCVLRLSGLYGPGRTRLIRQALRMRPYLKPEIWSNQIHRDDVAGVVAFLTELQEPPPPLLLVSDDRPALRREIFDWIREAAELPEGCYDEDHPGRATRDRGCKRVSNARLRALGAPLRYPDYRQGLAPYLPNRSGADNAGE
ncbi:MAG: NAD-dependent epimerase/dehydratase family protein [Verrucomicrobia bacterium]|nr:NAD-dependent epimerase/dehydratase family protein [Verrucomicrobiota bacterium]MCH8527265.1 NAD-dependent epimerase/dehydratase family protein [Kiritimatiellia bacterium]